MNFKKDQPIYLQIADFLKTKIIQEELQPGEQAPSVREIASELKVNPNTVQRAYQVLRNDDIFYAQRGLGNFVTENEEVIDSLKEEMSQETFENFLMEIKKLGYSLEKTLEKITLNWEEIDDSN